MKNSYRIFHLLLKFTVTILVLTLSACEPQLVEPYQNFLLPKGKHDSGMKLEALQSTTLRFEAIFDESAIYQTQTIENQYDINKLMGFSDCNSFHHDNSARFGWRWLEGNLEIHAYAYVNGERITQHMANVPLHEPSSYQIRLTDNSYFFYIQGFDPVEIKRENQCDKGLYYLLFPYFGGDEVAPQDIQIQVKINA